MAVRVALARHTKQLTYDMSPERMSRKSWQNGISNSTYRSCLKKQSVFAKEPSTVCSLSPTMRIVTKLANRYSSLEVY
jgi:hypothetical protein